MIVGNKNRFAIEFEICNEWGKMQDGKIILFINNFQVGSYDDINYLSIPCEELLSVLDSENRYYPEFKNKKISEIVKIFNTSDEDRYYSVIHLGESFDDFIIRAYKVDSHKICFLWKLLKNPFFQYPKYDYRSKSFELDISEVLSVVQQFKEVIAPYNPSLQ
jgi:hypothetical protein